MNAGLNRSVQSSWNVKLQRQWPAPRPRLRRQSGGAEAAKAEEAWRRAESVRLLEAEVMTIEPEQKAQRDGRTRW
jgi:hypothetical protein